MAHCIVSRVRAAFMLSVSVLALSACSDVEYAWDRTQQGASDAYDSVLSSKTSPKTTNTKVDISVPPAAPQSLAMQDVAQDSSAEPVVLGAMRDNSELLPTPGAPGQVPKTVDLNAQAPSETAMEAPATTTNEALGAPLMVIRFNQHHVYYDQALTKAVMAAEKAMPGMRYSIVSRLPDLSALSKEQQDSINSRASDNLHNVVSQMQQIGVPASRIKVANQKQDVRSQEIAVFVN